MTEEGGQGSEPAHETTSGFLRASRGDRTSRNQVSLSTCPEVSSAADAKTDSYGAIFSSTILVGGASILNVLIGLIRMKAAAILLGPAGIGLISLLTAMISTASTAVQLGMGVVGARQIAEAHASGDKERVAISRQALLLATIALSLLGSVSIWLFRTPLEEWTLGSAGHPMLALAVAIGVGLTVASTAQTALLQGMRRVKDIALLSVLGSSAATFLGVFLLRVYGHQAIPFFVIATPASAFAIGLIIVARVPKTRLITLDTAALIPHWKMYFRLGIPFMAASLVETGAELLIRIDVRTQLGLDMLGQYQASWTIAYQVIGFALGAMTAEYYPRLTASISRPQDAALLVNQQSEMALLLSGAIILAMFGWGPYIVAHFYSPNFSTAGDLLRWQASAQPLKALSWTLGFVILAAGSGRLFFLTESIFFATLLAFTHILLKFNLTGAGVAYLLVYVLNLPLLYFIVRRMLGFAWSRNVLEIMAVLLLLFGLLLGVLILEPYWIMAATLISVMAFSVFAASRLRRLGLTRRLIPSRFYQTDVNSGVRHR